MRTERGTIKSASQASDSRAELVFLICEPLSEQTVHRLEDQMLRKRADDCAAVKRKPRQFSLVIFRKRQEDSLSDTRSSTTLLLTPAFSAISCVSLSNARTDRLT
jgi:hypothetical protein